MSNRTIENENYFRNIVRERDKWKCQECGSSDYPQAHHIEHHDNKNSNPENGITLCVYCHADKHPEVPRNLFIANIIKAEKEGCISAGQLANELEVHPRTIVRHARKLGLIQPMQQWIFRQDEAESIRNSFVKPDKMKLEKKQISHDETINFKISSETKNTLNGIAKMKQLTLSDLVREAIDKYMRLTYFGEKE